MIKYSILFFRRLAILALICSFGVQIVNAAIIYDFSSPLTTDRIQYYLGGEANSAKTSGHFISTDKTILLDSNDPQKYAKTLKDVPSDQFTFGSWDNLAGSGTLLLRIWDGVAQTQGGSYTSLVSKSNSSGQTDELPFNINYTYIYATPSKATITQYSEIGTTVINPPSVSKTVTFASTSDQVNGKTVEIGGSTWTLTQGGAPVTRPGSGTSLTLDSKNPPLGITMNPGDKITLQVQHINLWGDVGTTSDPYIYSVGGAGVGVAGVSQIINLYKPQKLGINQFQFLLPNQQLYYTPKGSLNTSQLLPSNTIKELVNAINAYYGLAIVQTIGWWDSYPNNGGTEQKMEGYTITYNGNVISSLTGTAGTAGDGSDPLIQSRTYQLSVSSPVSGFKISVNQQ